MRYLSHLPNQASIEPRAFGLPPEELAALGAELGDRWRLVINPGEEFDSPGPLNHPQLEPVDDEAKAYAAQVAEQDAQHARDYHLAYGPSEGRPTPEFPQIEQPPVPMTDAEAAAAAAARKSKSKKAEE